MHEYGGKRRNYVAALLAVALAALALPTGTAAQEVAAVSLGGQPVFTVTGAADTSAVARARGVESRLETRLASDAPVAPVRAVGGDSVAFVVVAEDTLLAVTRADAEVALAAPAPPGSEAPLRVAQDWARLLGERLAQLAREERARVVVQGLPLFEVGGTAELRAARRAAAIGLRIGDLAGQAGRTPPIRAERRGTGAVVTAGGETLAEVTPAEAALLGGTPLEIARERAEAIEGGVRAVRGQRSPAYLLRTAATALATLLAAWVLGRLLRLAGSALDARQPERDRLRWGLLWVGARWLVSLAQLLLWTAVAVALLWLFPRTRPLVYTALDRAVRLAWQVGEWLLTDGLIVAVIVAATLVFARFVGAVVRQLVVALGTRQGGRVALRAGTLSGTAAAGGQVLVFFAGLVAVLAQLDINPVPLLASAGVAGIAIGFGVQSLIRDFFTGFFILLEDQYGVGDVIQVGTQTGRVERLTLRITQFRGIDGSLTSIPNGEIRAVTNLSKDWAQVVLDVHVALGQDVDRATAVIAETARALAAEQPDRIRGEPEVLGVEKVDPAARAITVRVLVKTAPLEQWNVSRELRQRLVGAFEEAGIEIPPRAGFVVPENQ